MRHHRIIRVGIINLMVGLLIALSACASTTTNSTADTFPNPTVGTTPSSTAGTTPNPTAGTTPNPTAGTTLNPTPNTTPVVKVTLTPYVDTVKLTKLSSDINGPMFVPCPTGEVVINGGWNFAVTNQFIPHDDAPMIRQSYPANNGWIIGFEPGN